MIVIDFDVFWRDQAQFHGWVSMFEHCLPGGFGLDRDWLPDDGLAPASAVNGPPHDMLLMTYPDLPPIPRKKFGNIPGSEAYYQGYLVACEREYEFIADGCIAMALFASLLLRTIEAWGEQEKWATVALEALREKVAEL